MYIYVPRDWMCDSLEIDAASATVEINDLTIRELDFDGASGTCNLENCIITDLDIDALDVVLANASGIVDNGISQDTELEAITYSIVEAVAYDQMTPEEGARNLLAQFEDRLEQLQ